MQIIYSIPAPYSVDKMIVVYGDVDNAAYEYRIEAAGVVLHDTTDAGYGCAEIALRDALIEVTRDV
jgi:hypothetical protein